MNICEWYDWDTQTCNRDDEFCPFACDNNKGMYGYGLKCEKEEE